jgi:hypothetical protein
VEGEGRTICKHTDLIQLYGVKLGSRIRQQLLCGAAVGAVGFREDGDGVVVDDALDFGFGGRHGGGAEGARGEEPL